MGARGADLVKNSVTHGNKRYATLDGAPADSTTLGRQAGFLALPSGWKLAEWSKDLVDNLISKFSWGTYYLVLSNGDAYATPLSRHEAGTLRGRSVLHQKNGLVWLESFTYGRVLICSEIGNADGNARRSQTLTSLWENDDFADCEVECDGEVFKCHRALLAQASPVLKRMFSGEMLEAKRRRVQIEVADAQVVAAFLKFMYTGTLECEVDHAVSLVKLADFYEVDALVDEACTAMMSNVHKDNILPIFRCLQSMRERPHFAPHWDALVDMVHQSKELTLALMTGV